MGLSRLRRPSLWGPADSHSQIIASVTSSTHERKSKTNIVMKHGKILLRHNAFT